MFVITCAFPDAACPNQNITHHAEQSVFDVSSGGCISGTTTKKLTMFNVNYSVLNFTSQVAGCFSTLSCRLYLDNLGRHDSLQNPYNPAFWHYNLNNRTIFKHELGGGVEINDLERKYRYDKQRSAI